MPTSPSWEDLLSEHRQQIIGPLWLDFVERTVRAVTPRYPARLYSETGEWNEQARENLVQTVVLDQLLEQHQLAYITATATSTRSATSLLGRVVRRTLAKTRRRTVIDNLLQRSRALQPMTPSSGPGASDSAVLAAAREVARVPRLQVHSDERAPAVYSTQALADVLNIARTHLGNDLTERDFFEEFLERVLTSYLPSELVHDDTYESRAASQLHPDQEAVVTDVLSHLLSDLTTEQQAIVAMKLNDRSDREVAASIGVSRPTAAKRFDAAADVIRTAIADLPTRVQDAVLSELPTQLQTQAAGLASRED